MYRVSNDSPTVDDFLRGVKEVQQEVSDASACTLRLRANREPDLQRVGGQPREGKVGFQLHRRWVQGRYRIPPACRISNDRVSDPP